MKSLREKMLFFQRRDTLPYRVHFYSSESVGIVFIISNNNNIAVKQRETYPKKYRRMLQTCAFPNLEKKPMINCRHGIGRSTAPPPRPTLFSLDYKGTS